jgi:hypothetical protein
MIARAAESWPDCLPPMFPDATVELWCLLPSGKWRRVSHASGAAIVCETCYREFTDCRCARTRPTPAMPGELLMRLSDRWTRSEPTVPEVRWFVSAQAEIDMHRVRLTRVGPRAFVVWVEGPLTPAQDQLLDAAITIARGAAPAVHLGLQVQCAETTTWYRADGGVACSVCSRPLRQHPVARTLATCVRVCTGEGAHL